MKRAYRSRSFRRTVQKIRGMTIVLQAVVLFVSYDCARRGLHLPFSMYLVVGLSLALNVQFIGVALAHHHPKKEG